MDFGVSGRQDDYSATLVDPFTLQEVGEEVGLVQGEGNVTWRYDAENIVSATLKLANSKPDNRLVRVKHLITMPDGETASETLGTFFADTSSADVLLGSEIGSIDCYSTLCRFTGDTLISDFTRPAGTNIVEEVRYVVEVDGGRLKVSPEVDSTKTHTVDVWFPVGYNRASLLRQIASWTSCELGVDDEGYVTWSRYVAPVNRASFYTFESGRNCVYKPGAHVTDTAPDAINRVIARFSRMSKADDDPLPLADYAIAELPDGHPFSYNKIGRKKTYDLQVQSPVSHEVLVENARKALDEKSGGKTYYEIEHASVLGLRSGHTVRYVNDTDFSEPVDCKCLVEEVSMDLSNGGMCSTKLRVIS